MKDLRDRVRGCLEDRWGSHIQYKPRVTEIRQLSENAIAIQYENDWGIEIYFDGESYCVKDGYDEAGKHGASTLFPPEIEKSGLGVLPGWGLGFRVKSFYHALDRAMNMLKPVTEEANWFSYPIKISA